MTCFRTCPRRSSNATQHAALAGRGAGIVIDLKRAPAVFEGRRILNSGAHKGRLNVRVPEFWPAHALDPVAMHPVGQSGSGSRCFLMVRYLRAKFGLFDGDSERFRGRANIDRLL
jgi:hypothetical protein